MLDGFAVGIALNVSINGLGKLSEVAESFTKLNGLVTEVEAKIASLGTAINTAFSSASVANFNAELRNSLSTVRQLTSAMGHVGGVGAGAASGTTRQGSAVNGISFADRYERADQIYAAKGIERERVASDKAAQRKLTALADYEAADIRVAAKQEDRERTAIKRKQENFGSGMIGTTFKMLVGFEAIHLAEKGFRAAADFDTEKATLRGQGYTPNKINEMVQQAAHTNVAGIGITDKLIGRQELNSILDPGGKRGSVTADVAKTFAQLSQYITKETGHGTVAGNQVILARAAQLMGLKVNADGSFDPESLKRNALMFARVSGAMGRNTDPEVYAHNVKQAAQYLRDPSGQGLDPHKMIQLGVLTEQLGGQAGSAFAALSRQSARGEIAGAQGRDFLVRFGLFGGQRMGDSWGFDPMARSGKGGMSVMDRSAVMKGFDPAHPERYIEVVRKAVTSTLTQENGGKPVDQAKIEHWMQLWQNKIAGRADAVIGTPAGLEEVKKLQEAYNLTAPNAEALAYSIRSFDGGVEALGKSLGSVIAILATPALHDLGDMFYGLSTGLDAVGGFLTDHPDASATLVRIGEGLAALIALSFTGKAGFWVLEIAMSPIIRLAGLLGIALGTVAAGMTTFLAGLGSFFAYLQGKNDATVGKWAEAHGFVVSKMADAGGFQAATEYYHKDTGKFVSALDMPDFMKKTDEDAAKKLAPSTPEKALTLDVPEITATAKPADRVTDPRFVPPVSPYVQHTWHHSAHASGGAFAPGGVFAHGGAFASTAAKISGAAPTPQIPKLTDFHTTNLYVGKLITGDALTTPQSDNKGISEEAAVKSSTATSKGISKEVDIKSVTTPQPDNAVKGISKEADIKSVTTPQPDNAVKGISKEADINATLAPQPDSPSVVPVQYNAAKGISKEADIGSTFAQKSPQIMQSLMKDLNITKEQAAGIVGNLGHESAGFKAYHQGGTSTATGGVGWAQWTGPRRKQFEAWSKTHLLDPRSDAANLGFLEHELKTSQAKSLAALRKTHTVADATSVFMKTNERPGVEALGNRLGYANTAYNLDIPQMANAAAKSDQKPVMPPSAQNVHNSQIDIHLNDKLIASEMFKSMFNFNPSANAGPTSFDKRMSPWAPGSSMP